MELKTSNYYDTLWTENLRMKGLTLDSFILLQMVPCAENAIAIPVVKRILTKARGRG